MARVEAGSWASPGTVAPEFGKADAPAYDASFFSLRKPRDLKAGLSSGGKSILKGVLAGTLAVLAAPAAGVLQDGWRGLPKGVVLGLVGGVLLPVTGVAIGVTQVVRGVMNTPEALRQSHNGKVWSQEQREWMEPPSDALVWDDDAFTQTRERWQASQAGGGDGEDLYALLGVPRDASGEAIKRQYYIMARRLHPDKNPDDPGAKERFQRLSEAYQVLGNAELRQQYDRFGRQSLDVDFMDPSDFFTALFGSDKFEHLVGELTVAAAARGDAPPTPAAAQKAQAVRVRKLAVLLAALLRRWVEGDEEGFKESMRAEGTMLAGTSYGAKILSCLGHTYELRANLAAGGILGTPAAAVHNGFRHVKFGFNAIGVAARMINAQLKLEKYKVEQQREEAEAAAAAGAPDAAAAEERQTRDAERQARDAARQRELEEAALPAMLDAMWLTNRLDIEATVRRVCREVLHGPGVPDELRRSRARGLRELGRIFQECAQAARSAEAEAKGEAGKGEKQQRAKEQVEQAMQQAFQRRQQ